VTVNIPASLLRLCVDKHAESQEKHLEVPCQDPLVVLPLQRRHVHSENALVFRGEGLLNILDDAPQKVRLQVVMQLADTLWVLEVVLHLEVLAAGKAEVIKEVEQGPELLHRVLQWRARDEQLVLERPCQQLLV
jgi:hypothetical protein